MLKQCLSVGFGVIMALFGNIVQGSESFCPDVPSEQLFSVGDTCYHYIEAAGWKVSYRESEADCRSRKGELLTLRDNQTAAEVVEWLNNVVDSHTILLGLRYIEGSWTWSTGDPLSFQNFDKTQASVSGNDCVKLKLMEDAVWEKFPCEETDWYSIYVCEHNQRSVDKKSGQGSFGSFIWIAVSTMVSAIVLFNMH